MSTQSTTTMQSSSTRRWLWCADHAAVNAWFDAQGVTYEPFYGSFINYCNQVWVKRALGPLQEIEQFYFDCVAADPIPAANLIEVLDDYNKWTGRGKGRYKSTGLVKFSRGLNQTTLDNAVAELHRVFFLEADGLNRCQRKNMKKRAQRRRDAMYPPGGISAQPPLPDFAVGRASRIGTQWVHERDEWEEDRYDEEDDEENGYF